MGKEKWDFVEEVPKEILEKLGKYVTNVGGRTFVIHGLPSELTGGVMARYSRSRTGLQLTLVNEFFDENGEPSQAKGTELMNRVLNAYGDESVGELEGVHVGIEDISQLGTKFIEDRRIGGSPIEQSTRYVRYDTRDSQGKWRYLRPEEVIESGLLGKFERVNDRAFEVYSEGIKKLTEFFKKEYSREKFKIFVERNGEKVEIGESELLNDQERREFNNGYNGTIRGAACDVGRCLLPASTLTHLGVFGNGRFFTNLISFMKSHELAEARERGCELEQELNKVIPTFIKRNRANPKISEINREMKYLAKKLFDGIVPIAERVNLISIADYIDEVVSSSLFPYTSCSLQQIIDVVRNLSHVEKKEILNIYKGNRDSRRDRTGRGIEAGYPLTFDLVGCFAEYRDLERHRMLTQQRQRLTTDLGFIMPPEMTVVGLEKEVQEVVNRMDDLNSDLKHAGLDEASEYATLFNHRMRFMLGMNLREFQHLGELRTGIQGHFSYRSMVMAMAKKITEEYPWAETFYGFVNYSDPDNRISRAKEQARISGKNLASGFSRGEIY
ncbi:FAD-dependent thymidylate synthase [Candidatus Pacearchaeota archaeon]|nr:FAD-dependent thymidylate synthase [Candidatus Pacearchaeota archaeon]